MDKVIELVDKHKLAYTEDLLYISHPPDYQCSNIDRVLSDLSHAEKYLAKAHRSDDLDEMVGYIEDAQHELYGMSDLICNLRTAIEEVREWGQEWKDECKKLMNDKENLEEYLGLE